MRRWGHLIDFSHFTHSDEGWGRKEILAQSGSHDPSTWESPASTGRPFNSPPYVFKSECAEWGLISMLNGYSNLWCTSSCRTGGWGREITDLLWLSQNPHGPNSAEGIGPHSSNGKMPQNIMHTIDNCATGLSLSFRAFSPGDSKVKGECSLLLSQAGQQHSERKRQKSVDSAIDKKKVLMKSH